MLEPQRLNNGVKARHDGKGDAWANMHREGLGNTSYMSDVDAMVGLVAWSQNTAERLFLEVVPDDFQNRTNEVRRFAVMAMFDRKRSIEFATSEANRFTRQFYTWLCRTIKTTQEEAPRFFYVIGGNTPPWTMYEVDIDEPSEITHKGLYKAQMTFLLCGGFWA